MADNKDARLTLLNQGPWGVLITDWTFRPEPPPVDLRFALGPHHIWQIGGEIDVFHCAILLPVPQ